MAKLFIIDEFWSEQTWFSTGGTRAKKYLQGPDDKFYYFKRSQIKPGKEYTFEFWNEIIAFELGTMLGFNMLRYDLAIDGNIMGCISQSMIDSENEELIEGVKYLQAYSHQYDPSDKEHKTWYTFDLIEGALKSAKIGHFIYDIIDVIIFDSIIGNGDRHQENWAIISHQKLITDILAKAEKEKLKNWQWKLVKWVEKVFKQQWEFYEKNKKKIPKVFYDYERRFAPIYDSGSSLGRELLDAKVNLYLQSDNQLNNYIEKGLSEIHWNNKKLTHFELIRILLETQYREHVVKTILGAIVKFAVGKISELIDDVDMQVPTEFKAFKIPENRKALILKIITLRIEKLKSIINEGV